VNVRIIKEARLLFWPWLLVIVAALTPLVSHALYDLHELSTVVCTLGFFAGIPFLAAYSFGAEFQHRTFGLLLGQPDYRTRIWGHKVAVLVPAVLAASLVFWINWPERRDLTFEAIVLVAAWLAATLAAATFWTLLARSTMGGLVLGQVTQFVLGAAAINIGLRILGPAPSPVARQLAEGIGIVLWLTYSGLMLWLGWRKLTGFQATGVAAGHDLLTLGPRVMPLGLLDWLRCQPKSPWLNLVRKELRLLRPLWLIVLMFLACWGLVVSTFPLLPRDAAWREWPAVFSMMILVLYVPLAIILSGSLSLGEERSSGTHAWHLTLPVPVRRQWFVKLLIALGAGAFSGGLVPLLAVSLGQGLLGAPFGRDFDWHLSSTSLSEGLVPGLVLLLAGLPAFWCASAVHGSVRASLWVLPVLAVLGLAGGLGGWFADRSAAVTGTVFTAWVSRHQLNPIELTPGLLGSPYTVLLFVMPTAMVALFQSARMFRRQCADSDWPLVRSLVPPLLTAFVSSWLIWTTYFATQWQMNSPLVAEASNAIERVSFSSAELEVDHPLDLTVDQLAKAVPVSATTRRWLQGSTITVTKTDQKRGLLFKVSIRFPDGSEFPMAFRGASD